MVLVCVFCGDLFTFKILWLNIQYNYTVFISSFLLFVGFRVFFYTILCLCLIHFKINVQFKLKLNLYFRRSILALQILLVAVFACKLKPKPSSGGFYNVSIMYESFASLFLLYFICVCFKSSNSLQSRSWFIKLLNKFIRNQFSIVYTHKLLALCT